MVFKIKNYIILHFVFAKVILQTCGVANPKNYNDCKGDSSANSICCYAHVSLLDDEETLCVYVPKSQVFITPYVTMMDIGLAPNNLKMKIDCGESTEIEKGQAYSVCGENPKNEEECFLNSTKDKSCCYISNPDGFSVCLLNTGVYNDKETYFGIKVVCGERGLKWFFIYMIFIFLII